jgi:membrane protein
MAVTGESERVEVRARTSRRVLRRDMSPWKLGGLSVRELGARVWSNVQNENVLNEAAALSYYFIFALFPAFLFVMALVAFVPVPHLMGRLMMYIPTVLPPDAASVVTKTVWEVVRGGGQGLLSVGAVLALWSASSAMVSVMDALNVAYEVQDSRPWWKRRLTAIVLTVVFSVFLLVGLVLMMFGPIIGQFIARPFGLSEVAVTVWNVVSVPIALLLVMTGIALVYYLAPDVEQDWRWVTPGAVLAVTLWVLMSLGLRFYATHFANYNKTYGSIGGIILLLLWLYLTGVVLLLGAEVNSEIEQAAARRGEPTAKAPGQKAA